MEIYVSCFLHTLPAKVQESVLVGSLFCFTCEVQEAGGTSFSGRKHASCHKSWYLQNNLNHTIFSVNMNGNFSYKVQELSYT